MPVLDHKLTDYLHETLGATVALSAWPGSSNLPPFLSDRYRFLKASLCQLLVLFMIDESPSEEPPAVIRKHLAQLRGKWEHAVVYVRARMTAYNRKRLVQQRVPFVVPGNQMYLPELGIDLREHFRKQVSDFPHFRPATQALFIHALLQAPRDAFVAADLAPVLGYTSMTLSRAFDEIESAGLAESRMEGRERALHFMAPRRELWKRAQTKLRSPVKARHFLEKLPGGLHYPQAGLSALSRYSMLAEPKNPVLALSREEWAAVQQKGRVIVIPVAEPEALEVEVWGYVPRPYRLPDAVDPLSLYLSLKSSKDERVEQALDHLLGELPW